MGMPGGIEWVIIALVVLLLFGGKKIPELAKGLGSGIKNFKKAVKEDEEVVSTDKSEEIEKKAEVKEEEEPKENKTV
ncbi:twin-arginine translocase TatA/TatE family subunit [Halarcobacter sp.]|uniref:twin-arginine translocase TatA/TatE family subunit n=1 Tax=Halarcobacter sp. TaxID=2321133 RepID=UPI002AABEBB9|nr:twin-arginine translocase TatA/TatE family subunit [Halarcobacter sp.]